MPKKNNFSLSGDFAQRDVKKLLLIVFIILSDSLFGQNLESITKSKDTIKIVFNENIYQAIAKDSISKIYYTQLESGKVYNGISKSYQFEDLSLKSIPTFRLIPEVKDYDCSIPIEDFIWFNDSVFYQTVLISSKNKYLSTVIIPNTYVEMEKVHNLEKGSLSDKSAYFSEVIAGFVQMPLFLSEDRILKDSDNFYFGIYGIKNVFFEIEMKSGLVYANHAFDNITEFFFERIPINDYIQKFVGEKMVKAIAREYYEDIDGTGELEGEPCPLGDVKIEPRIIKYEVLN